MSTAPQTFWTAADVAALLRRSPRWVERQARAGVIPARLLPGGELVFQQDEVTAWADALPRPRTANTPEPVPA